LYKNSRPLGEQRGVSGGNWFHPEGAERVSASSSRRNCPRLWGWCYRCNAALKAGQKYYEAQFAQLRNTMVQKKLDLSPYFWRKKEKTGTEKEKKRE